MDDTKRIWGYLRQRGIDPEKRGNWVLTPKQSRRYIKKLVKRHNLGGRV